MLRAMILTLVLLLITLSAAHLGQDEQLVGALRLARTPKPQPSAAQQPPAAASEAEEEEDYGISQAQRFVLNEPLPSLPPLEWDSSSGLDPSAQAQVAAASSQSAAMRIPTEEEKLAVAEPYVRELFSLSERSARELQRISEEAMGEYLAVAPDKRAASTPTLLSKYLPEIRALEAETDEQAEKIFTRMTSALAAIGADGAIAQDARDAYQKKKEEQTQHYLSMFSSLAN